MQNRSPETESRLRVSQGLGVRGNRVTVNGYHISFWDDENVPELKYSVKTYCEIRLCLDSNYFSFLIVLTPPPSVTRIPTFLKEVLL